MFRSRCRAGGPVLATTTSLESLETLAGNLSGCVLDVASSSRRTKHAAGWTSSSVYFLEFSEGMRYVRRKEGIRGWVGVMFEVLLAFVSRRTWSRIALGCTYCKVVTAKCPTNRKISTQTGMSACSQNACPHLYQGYLEICDAVHLQDELRVVFQLAYLVRLHRSVDRNHKTFNTGDEE